jgi:hypothetical protein
MRTWGVLREHVVVDFRAGQTEPMSQVDPTMWHVLLSEDFHSATLVHSSSGVSEDIRLGP